MFENNCRSTLASSGQIEAQAVSKKKRKESSVKRLLVGHHLLLVRVLLVALLMVLVSAAGLVRQPARAAVVGTAMQGDGLTAEAVVLDFDEGSHKKGEVISLARISREDGTPVVVSPPDKCLSRHLHGVIQICDATIGTKEGPFLDPFNPNDPNPHECGHGMVMPYRADVRFDQGKSELPLGAAVGDTLKYTLAVANDGPHTADSVLVSLDNITFNGVKLFRSDGDFVLTIEGADPLLELLGLSIGRVYALAADAVPRVVTFKLTIKNDKFKKAGSLAISFGVNAQTGGKCIGLSSPLRQSIDPNLSNNLIQSHVTEIVNVEAGSTPDVQKGFDLQTTTTLPLMPFIIKPVDLGQGGIQLINLPGGSNPSLLMPDNTGGFTPGPSFEVPADFKPSKIGVADVTGDGTKDIILGDSTGGFLSFPGIANGGYGSPIVSLVGSNPVKDFAIVEIGSNPDILAVNSGATAQTGNLTVFKGDKTGAFQKLSTITLPGVPTAIVTGDFNGDKKTDAAVTILGATDGSPGNVLLFSGDGAGNFSAGGTLTTGVKPSAIAVGDFNNDSIPDLAVANHDSNDVFIFTGDGSGGFTLAATVAVGTNPVDIVTGDFNGNGNIDLATANEGSNDVTILLGGGNALFIPTNVAAGQKPSSLVAADFNRDGKLDLAVANSGSSDILILLNGATPVTRPVVTAAEVNGKKLTVTGTNFDNGSVILVNGVEQGTANDSQNPTTRLNAKKGGKKLKPGRPALIQAKSSAGTFSEGLFFTRAAQ